MLQKCFLKSYLFLFIFNCIIAVTYGQKSNKNIFIPYKIGFLYNYGNEKNFLFDDVDYSYQTNTYKAQFFYKVGFWKKMEFDLVFEPQVQFLKHQLLNESFVQPSYGDNYLELRDVYTKQKSMNLYALELAINIKKQLFSKLDIQLGIGAGIATINTNTERLAKGFTFIENFSLGFNYKTTAKTFLYLGSNFGHVSNLDFQLPNDGYNILGLEVGLLYLLK